MIPALSAALLIVQSCSGPFCGPDSDFEHPAAGLLGESAAPVVAMAPDGAVLLAWEFRGEGESDIVFGRREPGPAGTWSNPLRLDTDAWGAARSLEPRLAVSPAGEVHVLWQDTRDGVDDLRMRSSTDGGLTWEAADRRVGGGVPGALRTMPSLAVDGAGRVTVVWEDLRAGRRDLWMVRSLDAGRTWQDELRVDTDPAGRGTSYHPQLSVFDDGSALVVWWDERDGDADVYVRRLEAGGAWDGPERRLDPGAPGQGNSRDVALSVRGDAVSVTWEDGQRDLSGNIVARTSTDGGRTWGELRTLGVGEDPVVVARGLEPLLAWAEPPPPDQGEKTSIGGHIVTLPPPTGMPWQVTAGRPVRLDGLERLASRWAGRSADRAYVARGGSAAGRGLVDLYAIDLEGGSAQPVRAALLRFGAELMATDVDVHARSLAGAVADDGAVHLVWVTSYGERDDLGAVRLSR